MIYLSTKNEHGLDGRALRSRRGIGVRVSFQSREFNVLTEHVPDALKQSAVPKRAIEEVGVVAVSGSGQLVKAKKAI